MTDPAIRQETGHQHSGGENLEVMREAKKYNRFLQQLVRRYGDGAETALDFGAGIGTFSGSLDISPRQVHCVEPDPAARIQLRQTGFQTHEQLSELADSSVSFIFSLNVLEHIDDDLAILKEMFRVLKPGGRVLIYVPAFASIPYGRIGKLGSACRIRRKQEGVRRCTRIFRHPCLQGIR